MGYFDRPPQREGGKLGTGDKDAEESGRAVNKHMFHSNVTFSSSSIVRTVLGKKERVFVAARSFRNLERALFYILVIPFIYVENSSPPV